MCNFKRFGVEQRLVSANYSSSFFFSSFILIQQETNCPIWLSFKEVTDGYLEMEKNAKATEPSLVASYSSQVLISLVCKWALWSGRKESERQQELSFREKDQCFFLILSGGLEP